MRQGHIYKITNPTGAIYIGQTVDLKGRTRHYRNLSCQTQKRLYRSIVKYGWDNHLFELIDACDEDQLNEREVYWIAFYNSCNNGLNLNHGGKGNTMSDETRASMSERRKNNPRGAVGKSGKEHYNYGRKATPEIRMALSLSHKGLRKGKANNKFRGYVQAFKDNVFVGRYEGTREAAAILGVHSTHISKVLYGKARQTGGYTFTRETI